MKGTARFYDELAEYYDLVYRDWEASMLRHGRTIAALLQQGLPNRPPASIRVLDAAAGIGTQTLPLASRGFAVVARDLSPASIARLAREAAVRRVVVDVASVDMVEVAQSVSGAFDAVIAFDNALPHLPDDSLIVEALRGFRSLMQPAGLLLLSLRDYSSVDRSPESFHPYGERTRGGRTFRLGQHWRWLDVSHYRTLLTVEELMGEDWRELVSTESTYYAVPLPRMLELISEAGFATPEIVDTDFFQPVVSARKSG